MSQYVDWTENHGVDVNLWEMYENASGNDM